ncbi:MAG: long-chain fatty acid--CoA ligase [Acetobacteraceae bacterium]|nr:long-chain fatty acid--CoA ligase [Acetobacteraceae bacterium]
MMFDLAEKWPRKALLRAYRDAAWHTTSWAEFGRMTASCARHLRAQGIVAGDRVLISAENRPDYPIAEVALMAIRAVPVPTYTTNTIDDHAHVLRDSGARAAIVSPGALADRVRAAGEKAGGLDLLLEMGSEQWIAMLADTAPQDDIARDAAMIPPTAMACLIYTSGTGGAPRGVMLPHRSIMSNCRGAFELVRPLRLKDEIYLSYLPLSHSYEHTVGNFFFSSIGSEIVYSRGVEFLAADMLAIRPTILTAVPRVLEVIRGRVLAQVARQPPWKQRLFERALAIGFKRQDGVPLTLAERAIDPILDRLVRAKIHARFGGRLVAAVSGGARLEPEVGRFFLALGMLLLQGYGQTEAGPVISATPPESIRIETVGPPLEGVDLRLAEDGEILVRGDLVMDGYWGRPEDTAAAIQDGWLHTGDIGTIDDRGNLRITDRKKDMIVLSGGENVSPAKIEGMLMAEPEIAQAVVAGDGRAGLTALLVPAEGHDDVSAALAISRTNHRLSVTERIRRHAVVEPFTVENGLLTPTQKIRRMLVIRANVEVMAKLHG